MSEQGSLSPIYPLGVIYPTVIFFFRLFLSFFSFSACKLSKRYFYTFLPNQFLAQVKFSFSSILFALSLSYIKRFVRCNLYDSQSVFKFILRFHYHTSSSYQVHKNCSYRVFSLQELKQNDSRASCSSSNYCTNFREKQVKEKEKKKEETV